MKILYIASNRRAAELAGAALKSVATDVGVVWISSVSQARRWIDENRRVAAIIVEVASDDPQCESFIIRVRDLGVTAPVIVVPVTHPAPPLTKLRAVADEIVPKVASFLNHLPEVVSRILQPPQSAAPPAQPPSFTSTAAAKAPIDHLEKELEAARRASEDNRTREQAEARAREALERQVAVAVAAAADRLKPENSEWGLEEAWAKFTRGEERHVSERHAPAEKLAALEAALREAEQRHETEVQQLAHAATAQGTLEQRLNDALRTIERARQDRAADTAAAADRESELIARLGEATGAVQKLEQHLVDRDAALRKADERAAIERQTESQESARRQTELAGTLTREGAQRRALEAKLAEAGAEFTTSITNAVGARDALERRLNDAVAASEQVRQDRATDAAAAADRESDLTARLGEATAAVQKLQQHLVDREAALRKADERAAIERQTESQEFARRQTELEGTLTREGAQRRALEAKLAEAEAEFTTSITNAVGARDALERRLNDTLAAIEQARQDRAADAAAAAEHLVRRDAELTAQLGAATATQERLERRLADANASGREAAQSAATELHAVRQKATERQAEIEGELARETANRHAVEQQLVDAKLARQRADDQHASERSNAAARLVEYQKQADAQLAQAVAAHDAQQAKLADAAAALQRAEQQAAVDRQVVTQQASQRQAEFEDQLAEEVAKRQALEKRLSSETSHAAARLTEVQKQADARLARAAAAVDALQARLVDGAAALQRAEQQAVADRQAAGEEAAHRRATFDTELTQEVARRQTLAKQLADAQAAHQHAEQQHVSELATTVARHTEYQTQAEAQLAHAATAADALRAELTDAIAGLTHAEQRAVVERQAASDAAAQRQVQFDTALAQQVAKREGLEKQLADREAAHQRTAQQHASELAAAAARLAEYQKQTKAELAQAVADGAAALQAAEQQAAAEGQAAANQALQRQATLETELGQEIARRQAVEGELADTREASEQAQLRFLTEVDAMRQRAHEHGAHLEERAAQERAEWESRLVERQERIGHLLMEGDLARESLAASQEQIQRLDQAHQEERANLERARIASEVERANLEHRLHLTLEARDRDSQVMEQLQAQLRALGEELEATRSQREVLKTEADRVPLLQKQIDDMHADNRHQFDHNPVSLCSCRRDGAMTQVNHALTKLLKYDTPEELLKVSFAATVFESADELKWMAERCLATRSPQSVDTTWRRKDGSRIIVRVTAVATTPDSIALAVEDITAFRALEEKLRNAQRMEAVARYASEVAVTCDNLLGNVTQEGQQWLGAIDSETARHHGELLLDEVTRAKQFLQQLAAYGNEQKNVPELVEVNQVLRDLESVLKRVAGDNIALVLPKDSTPINLDVEAERVERILVNVAAYGRERMPFGGRLVIDVASVVVDRNFVAKYPNVRPGPHVVLTVTEVRGALRPDWSVTIRKRASSVDAAPASDRPGVDLGALQALVSDCGGHLWMMAEPPGNMVLKIHLPRRVLDDRVPAKRRGRARWINRLSGART